MFYLLKGPFQKGNTTLVPSTNATEEYEKRIKSFPIDEIEEGDSVCLRFGAWEDESVIYNRSRGIYFVVETSANGFIKIQQLDTDSPFTMNKFFTSHWHIQRFDLVEKLSPIDRLMQKIGYYQKENL